MIGWQRTLRLAIGVFVIGFAGAVYLAIRPQQPDVAPAVARTDPTAQSEVNRGRIDQWKGSSRDWTISFRTALEYAGGTRRLRGITATFNAENGREFQITGDEGAVAENQSSFTITGNVKLTAHGGLTVRTEQASYADADGVVRVPGPVSFEQRGLRGTAVGMTCDQRNDELKLLAHVRMEQVASGGEPPATVESGTALWARSQDYVRYEGGARISRGGRQASAETVTARLAPVSQMLEVLELRGSSTLVGAAGESFPGLHARDIDLRYLDGDKLRQSLLSGDAVVDLPSGARGEGRAAGHAETAPAEGGRGQEPGTGSTGARISADFIDIGLGEDGTTVVSLLALAERSGAATATGAKPAEAALRRAELVLPAGSGAPARSIRANSIAGPVPAASPVQSGSSPDRHPEGLQGAVAAAGAAGPALSSLRFAGGVEYRETPNPPGQERVARAPLLDVSFEPGFTSMDRARFGGGVTFEQGSLSASSPDATYLARTGSLQMSASDAGGVLPRLHDEHVSLQAERIDLATATSRVAALGRAQAVFSASKNGGDRPGSQGLFARDEPAYATADEIDYDAGTSAARLRSTAERARVWQTGTTIYAKEIAIDNRGGNLKASGSVATTLSVEDKDPKTGRTEKTRVTAEGDTLDYDSESRQATYRTKVRMDTPQGDLTADSAVLTFARAGGSLERLEAHRSVTLRAAGTTAGEHRTVTGDEMIYTASDEQYRVVGNPVKYAEESFETEGATLTFYRSVDRIVIDGRERTRTRAKGGQR